jgi:hypothetical protein
MPNIEKLPRTIQILLNDNISEITRSINEDSTFLRHVNPDWIDDPENPFPLGPDDGPILPIPREDRWRIQLRSIPDYVPLLQENNDNPIYNFYYDKELYDPYLIKVNLSEAYQLHNDCLKLQKKIRQIKKDVLTLKLKMKLNNDLENLNDQEFTVLKNKLKTISNASTLEKNDSNLNAKIDNTVIDLELEYIKKVKKINSDHKKNLYKQVLDRKSVLSQIVDLERLATEYWRNFTELVMCIQAIKHGLYLTYGIVPDNNQPEIDSINSAEDLFEDRPEDIFLDDLIKPKNQILLFEDYIRDFLWKTTDKLKSFKRKTFQTIKIIKYQKHELIKDYRDPYDDGLVYVVAPENPIADFSIVQENNRKINDAWKYGELFLKFPKKNSIIQQIKGIYIEFNLLNYKETLKNRGGTKPYGNNTKLEFIADKSLPFKNFEVTITPPVSEKISSEFSFSAPIVQSKNSLFINGNRPPFYGNELIENINPQGFWKINFPGDINLSILPFIENVTAYYYIDQYKI